jgi:hypothetical protein
MVQRRKTNHFRKKTHRKTSKKIYKGGMERSTFIPVPKGRMPQVPSDSKSYYGEMSSFVRNSKSRYYPPPSRNHPHMSHVPKKGHK